MSEPIKSLSEAKERVIDVALKERLGDSTPPDLHSQIMSRAEEQGKGGELYSISHWKRYVGIGLAAACLLVGLGLLMLPKVEDYYAVDYEMATAKSSSVYDSEIAVGADNSDVPTIQSTRDEPDPMNVHSVAEIEALPDDTAAVKGIGIGDEELEALAKVTSITTLILAKCDAITDSGLSALKHKLIWLEDVALSFCTKITGTGVNELRHCKYLRNVNLRGCKNVSVAGAHNLAFVVSENITVIMPDGRMFPDGAGYTKAKSLKRRLLRRAHKAALKYASERKSSSDKIEVISRRWPNTKRVQLANGRDGMVYRYPSDRKSDWYVSVTLDLETMEITDVKGE